MKNIVKKFIPILSAGIIALSSLTFNAYAECKKYSYSEYAKNDIELLSVVYSLDIEKGKLEFSREADLDKNCDIDDFETVLLREKYPELFEGEPDIFETNF